jgi:hypothetical protein
MRSDSKVQAQNHVLLSDTSMCWEVNTKAGILSIPCTKVPSCAACVLFLWEKALYSHMCRLSSNKEAPYQYPCESPCTEDLSPSPANRKSKDSSSAIPIVDITPKKKKWSSPRDNVPQNDQSSLPAATNKTAQTLRCQLLPWCIPKPNS